MSRQAQIGIWTALVVICVLAGVAIAGLPDLEADDGQTVVVDTTSSTEADATPTTLEDTDDPEPTTTTTAAEVRPPAEVPVLVANGTTVTGAAARYGDILEQSGHPVTATLSTSSVDRSVIWYQPGWETEGVDLAERMFLAPDQAQPIPPEPSPEPGDAALVVVVGPDLAERP